MKGLNQFIVDLRNAHDADEERKRINVEINNIHTKLALLLNSYQKKKYVCKLIYMHLMGYTAEVAFGVDTALELMRLPDYLEKQLGYLLVSVLTTRDGPVTLFFGDLLEMVHVELVRDLRANSEDSNCLALQFIASNFHAMARSTSEPSPTVSDGDPAAPLWQELIDMVYSLCVSPVAQANTRKRAVAALNVMLKLYPTMVETNDNWIPRLVALVDDTDLSVVLAVVPLVRTLTDVRPAYARSIVPSIANRLSSLVVDHVCPEEYYYYEVPAPWLAIALIQLVEHFFLGVGAAEPLTTSDLDAKTVQRLRLVVARAIQDASRPVKGHPTRNTQLALLFQAVSLATFLDASPEAVAGATQALVTLLHSAETNTRYLVLDALVKLAARTGESVYFHDAADTVEAALRDKDVSVRRKAVDVLYAGCNASSYTRVVACLLDYYPMAESSLKNDIAVKVAVLAEKHATDLMWYVTTMLRLLAVGGLATRTGPGADIWERIIQIVVNNEDLHAKTAKYVMSLLRKPGHGTTPENLVKVAAFVLGEYGHTLGDECPASRQFQTLYDAYFRVSLSTRPIVLTALLKLVLHHSAEDFVADILDLLEAETQSLDLEIQTRAYEYLRIASGLVSGTDAAVDFAKAVVLRMPPFENTQNALLRQLGSVQHVGGSKVNVLKIRASEDPFSDGREGSNQNTGSTADIGGGGLSGLTDGFGNPGNVADVRGEPTVSGKAAGSAPVPLLLPNWYEGYHRMLLYDAGIFYEDQLIKLTYRTIKDNHTIRVKFTIINNAARTASTSITAFTVRDIHSGCAGTNPSYVVTLTEVPDLTIADRCGMELEIRVRDIVENNQSPTMVLSYKCSGSFNTLTLKVPVVLAKTLSGTPLALDDFKRRWLQIGDHLASLDGESKGTVITRYRHTSSNIVRLLQRMGFSVVYNTADSDEGVLVMGAGILHTVKSNYGVLITVKSLDAVGRNFDIVVRSTGEGVSGVLYETLEEAFQSK